LGVTAAQGCSVATKVLLMLLILHGRVGDPVTSPTHGNAIFEFSVDQ